MIMPPLGHNSNMSLQKQGIAEDTYHLAAVLRSYQKMISVKELEPVFAQENEARRKEAERREASQDRMANFQLQADLVSRRIGAASVSSDSNSEPDST